MRLLDLFAGIGGFSLAAHWMGWETVAFVEWAKYPQKVLAKNLPAVIGSLNPEWIEWFQGYPIGWTELKD